MNRTSQLDVQNYYRQVTEIDIGDVTRDLLAGRITQESAVRLECDCPNHHSQSHRSLHIMLDKQGWYCFGCGVGGDVLQLVEFIESGVVTRGQSGQMPESHRRARDFLAARVGMPPLAKLGSGESAEVAEESHRLAMRVREVLTRTAELYHERLAANPNVLAWFRKKYRIGDETIANLKIGYADNEPWTDADGKEHPSVVRTLLDEGFTTRELTAASAFRPTMQDGVMPFFERRIVFPYWSRGHVVFMIGRQTPWTAAERWEQSKYKKLAIRNDRNNDHVAPCVRNDVLYNEDVLIGGPERVIITEGVTDCISLMEYGFPAVSPVTVRIREADWERLLPKLAGVRTVYVCQDNEVSDAGLNGALQTARVLAERGIVTRVAVLPLGEKQTSARRDLKDGFGVDAHIGPRELEKLLSGRPADEIARAQDLLADAKIDVNEYFAGGASAADFEEILAAAQTPVELAIAKLSAETPAEDLSRVLEPILAEVGRLAPIDQDRHLKLIQSAVGKDKLPVTTLRKQLKVVEIDRKSTRRSGGRHSRPPRGSAEPVLIDRNNPKPLPEIQLSNRQLLAIIDDAWSAVHAANRADSPDDGGKPFLFQRGGALVRISETDDGPTIEHLNEASAYGVLARTANWHRMAKDSIVAAPPPRDVARDMLVNPDRELPHLESLIQTPAFGKDGSLISSPGYHSADRLWLFPDESLVVPEVPMEPTADQIAAARSLLLDDLFVDFPFVTPADRAHAVAAVILPFIRRMIDGPTPIHLVEAPSMGSGKGLLTNLISIVSSGTTCDARTMPEYEDEVRKMLTAELIKGRPIILLDNISEKKKLDSANLASIVTSPRWTDRYLGESRMVTVANNALWLMTANNPRLSDEMPRRCVRVRIDPRVDRPWLRERFKHPVVAEWAKQNRSALVHAVLTLIQAWIAAGRPVHPVRLGSFEAWSATLGGILDVAQIPGFLGNLDELYESADTDGQMWREFTEVWWEAFHNQPQKVSELNRLCEDRDLMLSVRGDGSPRSQQTRLGKALSAKRDRVFDALSVKRVVQNMHKGAAFYALTPLDGDVEPPENGQKSLDLIDFNHFGDVGDVVDANGDVSEQRPHELSHIESITFGDDGDVGDVFDHTPCGQEKKHISGTERNKYYHRGSVTGPNVPNVPKSPASRTKQDAYPMGTFADNVPMTSPTSPSGNPGGIDLANLPKEWDAPGGKPP